MDPNRVNLADPDFEPTDEQLQTLSKRAFADVARQHADALQRLEAAIAERRKAVLERVQRLRGAATAR
ncbi:MAG: hypothetical protein F9K40_07190 [Kofleriaceae bacterium]|nr:MAG: hypothetical protein F9K40_07190 [Kofleriaceae bacterium]MBZ0231963.1 hypothetical protein [Kofleriaceae bacterium]